MKDISLIGFMGCGKSSVGKILATLLPECRLIDLDTYIEEKQGKDIPEIFNEYGEAAFRRMEREALEEIFSDPSRPRTILSLGGGTVTSESCRQLIRRHTDCFYLRATTETLLGNLGGHSEGRPMLSSAQPPCTEILNEKDALRHRIESLMQTRSHQYLAAAHHIIDIDGQTFAQIATLIKETVEHNTLNVRQ
ncbi:MAG TPA: hypothetical protein DDX40_04170 [Rikenellaceae bacterium]|nr:hypothetical protein [Rikenellaceae bacterium]